MKVWLKSVGSGPNPLTAKWQIERNDLLEMVCFPQRPSVRAGDLIIYYAAGIGKICAVVKANSNPVQGKYPPQWTPAEQHRWPWSVGIELRIAIAADDRAPTLADINVNPLSIRRKSHIALAPQQSTIAIQLIRDVAVQDCQIEMYLP